MMVCLSDALYAVRPQIKAEASDFVSPSLNGAGWQLSLGVYAPG
jgi:hypothetical protein